MHLIWEERKKMFYAWKQKKHIQHLPKTSKCGNIQKEHAAFFCKIISQNFDKPTNPSFQRSNLKNPLGIRCISMVLFIIYRKISFSHLLFLNCQSSRMEMKLSFIDGLSVPALRIRDIVFVSLIIPFSTCSDWFKSAINKIWGYCTKVNWKRAVQLQPGRF